MGVVAVVVPAHDLRGQIVFIQKINGLGPMLGRFSSRY